MSHSTDNAIELALWSSGTLTLHENGNATLEFRPEMLRSVQQEIYMLEHAGEASIPTLFNPDWIPTMEVFRNVDLSTGYCIPGFRVLFQNRQTQVAA